MACNATRDARAISRPLISHTSRNTSLEVWPLGWGGRAAGCRARRWIWHQHCVRDNTPQYSFAQGPEPLLGAHAEMAVKSTPPWQGGALANNCKTQGHSHRTVTAHLWRRETRTIIARRNAAQRTTAMRPNEMPMCCRWWARQARDKAHKNCTPFAQTATA